MDQVIYTVIMWIILSAVGGLLGGLMLLGLSHSSDRLFEKTGVPLKYQALVPPLIMTLVGLFTSLVFIPYALILYGFAILLLCIGREYFFGRHILKQLIGVILLGPVTIPFMMITLYVYTDALGPGWYSFYIHNHGDHEIVVKEVQVDGQEFFSGERGRDRGSEVTLPPDLKTWADHWGAEFSRWPEKITLRVYDSGLQKEIQGEVSLPRSEKNSVCGFDIVYEPEGFRYDDRPCS